VKSGNYKFMSKIGKKAIEIPSDVNIVLEGNTVKVTGPKGSLECNHEGRVNIQMEDGSLTVLPKQVDATQFQGLYRTLIANLIEGVKNGVSKKLEFHGIGYKASVEGNGDLALSLGFSHPVKVAKTPDVTFSITDNVITVSGINKVLVGDMAAKIRAIRPPEPYKGKGIRYAGEQIIKKETKSA